MRKQLLAAALLTIPFCGQAQNLIQNPGAESATAGTWTVAAAPGSPTCNSTLNWRGTSGGWSSSPRSGTSFLVPGCNGTTGGTYELYQDVSVSGNAAAIDAGNGVYTFAGWYSSWNQSSPDQTAFVEEYRNASNAVISSYNSGFITSATDNSSTQSPWTRLVNTATLPTGTRTIRIRLLAKHNSGSAIDSYFDDISLVTGSSPLPIGLTEFSCNKVATGIKVSWKDSRRAENTGYNVYWSTNSKDWQLLSKVENTESGDITAPISYVHQTPAAGKNFYRLASIAKSGELDYSSVLSIAVSEQLHKSVTVSPVPASDKITLTEVATSLEGTSATVLDVQGRIVLQFAVHEGAEVNIQNWTPGIYSLRLTDGAVLRIVKQ